MIQVNELRVGNLAYYPTVNLNNGNAVDEIIEVSANDIKNLEISHGYLKPIPLTEEWLLKFGFERIGGQLWDCNEVRGLFVFDEFQPLAYLHGKRYVHQLQNLYHALTGEELKIQQ